MSVDNPVVRMLCWRVRKLSLEEVAQVLSAVAAMGGGAFTLTDVIKMLPPEFGRSRKKRRSVGTLLQNLAKIGYLSKPSERKWVKNAATLSHYLSQSILELSELEKGVKRPPRPQRVVGLRERLERRPSSK